MKIFTEYGKLQPNSEACVFISELCTCSLRNGVPHLSVLIRGTIFSHYFQSSLLFLTVTVLEGWLNVDMNAFLWKVCMCPCVCVHMGVSVCLFAGE